MLPTETRAFLIEQEVLANKLEGNVYAHDFNIKFGADSYMVHRTFYTVYRGVVHIIEGKEGKTLTISRDSIYDIEKDCTLFGDYNDCNSYMNTCEEMTLVEMNNSLMKNKLGS